MAVGVDRKALGYPTPPTTGSNSPEFRITKQVRLPSSDDAQLTTSSGSVVVRADADLRLGLREAQFHFLLSENILHGKQ